ncbi:MAG: Hsp20/alpha crystallin family protein [Candidatus Aminicenantes bacterium]|nr:MAG: Hsp20/alpha crystallin family protein [Candidatus Aminicenantes bacterium]
MMILRWSPIKRVSCFNPFYTAPLSKDVKEDKDNGSDISWLPAADIYDTKDDYVLKVEIPGLSKKDVKIEVENDTLSVSGERKEEKDIKEDDYRWSERRSGKFHRAFRLPKNTDAKKINASMKDGILELKVPKPEVKKPKNIPITVH